MRSLATINAFGSAALALLALEACETLPPPQPPIISESTFVYFEFDRTNITETAATTIRTVIADTKAGAIVGRKFHFRLTGHTDRSGQDAYNMALSLNRAEAVKDALVREGIPTASIEVVGRGESQPLAQTADGVREGQNRRVGIVY